MQYPSDGGPVPSAGTIRRLHDALLAWWDRGHRDLPWRRTRDPYAILVSEIMLQQTQVSRVVPKYLAFLERFPSLRALAQAPVAEVIRHWSGLGYNRRAVNLHRLARVVVDQHDGRLPRRAADLRALPGIGPYTARAVAAIAFNEAVAPVDTNVRRVLTRVVDGIDSDPSPRAVQELADALAAQDRPSDWSQALMELGALVCLPVPQCLRCPLHDLCAAAGSSSAIRERRAAYRTAPASPAGRYEGSSRFYRGRIVDVLRAEPAGTSLPVDEIGARLRLDYSAEDRAWLEALLAGLVRDRLVDREGDRVSLPAG